MQTAEQILQECDVNQEEWTSEEFKLWLYGGQNE